MAFKLLFFQRRLFRLYSWQYLTIGVGVIYVETSWRGWGVVMLSYFFVLLHVPFLVLVETIFFFFKGGIPCVIVSFSSQQFY